MRFPQVARHSRVNLRTLRRDEHKSCPAPLYSGTAKSIERCSDLFAKVLGAAAAAQTSLIVTSTFPRIALEYVQIFSAASTTS
jgi:hypothetical protein